MIVIVDYGVGNLGSIRNMLARIGVESRISSDPADFRAASKLILPGVGAFDTAMERLRALEMIDVLTDRVMADRVPTLGICLGMQLMTKGSEEGVQPGLGWVDAQTVRFRFEGGEPPRRLPHMGWNVVNLRTESALFAGLETDARFYFVHTYHVRCANLTDVVATSTYGAPFHAAFRQGNVMATQFHPEKSHRFGMRLLENFSRM